MAKRRKSNHRSQTKLLLIPCSGEETTNLARDIFEILSDDYDMSNQIEFLDSNRRDEVPKDMIKDHRHIIVSDYFPDGEVQVDIGRNELKDVIRGKHVALVEHLLTPNRRISEDLGLSVNDHIMQVRGFLDLISNVETLKRTLVSPYLTYVRSHSIEKYQSRGFFQFDSLRKTLKDYRNDGLDALLTIDPHSEKATQIANDLGLEFHTVNPFQSGRAINPYKLGLSGDKARIVLPKLRPFQERFKKLKNEKKNNLYLISIDDGAEKRNENFTERGFLDLPPEEAYAYLGYLDKNRISYDNKVIRFKDFSPINENNIDQEGTYIIIDDMLSTSGSVQTVAKHLKKLGAKIIEVWTSHAVTMPQFYEKANNRNYIDKIISLDTVPQSFKLDVQFIPASAHLLSAELYKAHNKLITSR